MTDCDELQHLRLRIFGNHKPEPPYTNIKVYQLVAFLRVINLPSLEMKPYLEQYTPTSIPDEARPTPPPPIVDGQRRSHLTVKMTQLYKKQQKKQEANGFTIT